MIARIKRDNPGMPIEKICQSSTPMIAQCERPTDAPVSRPGTRRGKTRSSGNVLSASSAAYSRLHLIKRRIDLLSVTVLLKHTS